MAETDWTRLSRQELQAEIAREQEQRRVLREETTRLREEIRTVQTTLSNLRAEQRQAQRLTRGPARPIALWHGIEVPNDAWQYVYQHARTLQRVPDAAYYNRMARYGVDREVARQLHAELLMGTVDVSFVESIVDVQRDLPLYEQEIAAAEEAVSSRQQAIAERQDEILRIEAELKRKEEARRRAPKRMRIWEFTRYYRYRPLPAGAGGRSSDYREFEVRVYIPFLGEWTSDQVADYEDEAEALCEEAMALVWRQPELAVRGFPDNMWELLKAEIPFSVTSRGYEPSRQTVDLSETETTEVWATADDKTDRYWTGWIRLVAGAWRIPEWTPP